MNKKSSEEIQEKLFEFKDLKYKEFHSKLIPTVSTDKIIGVRVPVLRKFAKDFSKDAKSREFLKILPHRYYEEDNLHAFIIEEIKDFKTAICETEKFLPYIDNWATCDMFFPKVFRKNKSSLLPYMKKWINSDKTYTVRYAIGLYMKLFLHDDFKEEYMEKVSSVKSEEYYIKMMVAWYFATALSNQYEIAIKYLKENRLDKWTHNKAIQKAIESNRIPKETKDYLKTFKI